MHKSAGQGTKGSCPIPKISLNDLILLLEFPASQHAMPVHFRQAIGFQNVHTVSLFSLIERKTLHRLLIYSVTPELLLLAESGDLVFPSSSR